MFFVCDNGLTGLEMVDVQKTKDELNSLMGLALNDRSYDYYENGYPIRDKLNKNKAEYIQALSEDIELFREYVEKENEFRALSYIIISVFILSRHLIIQTKGVCPHIPNRSIKCKLIY